MKCRIFVMATVVFSGMSNADVFDQAQWLRDPVFKGISVIELLRKEKAPEVPLSGPQNAHTYFRKEVELASEPASAVLSITGDDYYKFYVNGTFVVQGPESGYPFAHPYYTLEIAPFLKKGRNCLAAHAYYQGLYNRVWNSADNRSGFILELDVTYMDGTKVQFVTDDSWTCFQSKTYPGERTMGYKTQFEENVDMRLEPQGWRKCGFDDAAWLKPLVERQDHVFSLQMTPPLQHAHVKPVLTKDKGKGNWFYDFGTEIAGHTRVKIKGSEGTKIEVRHGEELSAPDTVRYDMRANCRYQEFPVLSGKDDVIEFYDYKAFRYIEILNAPSEPEVWVDMRCHPFAAEDSVFQCSNPLLTDIWRICKAAVNAGSQGGFLDCPTREKGPYLGDALITSRSHLLLTADASLTKKTLNDFHLSQRICPGIMAVAPGSFSQEIAEYSLQWVMLLRNYYQLTGDVDFARYMVQKALPPLFEYFARFESSEGLITGMAEKWVLVDWPANLRDEYDYDYAKERENAVVNAFYYESLRAAAEMCRAVGEEGAAYDAKAERVKESFQEKLLDRVTGLFLDAPGSKHSSLHANALALCFGLVEKENENRVIELIRSKRLSCGVYIAPFVIEGLYRAGQFELAYDLITSKDEHSWHEMLKNGATTCMEAWGPDQKKNASWCHPWSSSPIYLITEHVMGLTPAEPGWKKVRFEPHMPESLEQAFLSLPLPNGSVSVRYLKESGFVLTLPEGVEAEVAEDIGAPVRVVHSTSHSSGELTDKQADLLEKAEWSKRVKEGPGVWVSVSEQKLRVVEGGRLLWEARCSTAKNGIGSEMDSNKTPLGWHSVAEKFGQNAPWGQVFREKKPNGEQWKPGQEVEQDLVLTRLIALSGEEPGRNKGGKVDSYARCIYIHGTNDEERIGTPTSHGCVRLTNDDAILAFERIPVGAPVLIAE